MEWKEIQEKLGQPTPKDKIKQRKGFNDKMLSYVDAGYVIDVLDEVVVQDAVYNSRYNS